MNPGLLLRTLEHLRWEQLVYRPIRIVQSRLDPILFSSRWTSPRDTSRLPREASIEAIGAVVRSLPHLNPPLSEYESRIADLGENRFTFLNRTLSLEPINWNERYESHLWSYNLHYFAYSIWCARAHYESGDQRAFDLNKQLILGWIENARLGVSDGWAAYPVSLRVVNWIYAYAIAKSSDAQFLRTWSSSIYRQLDYLSRHLEYHLLANHIIKNAKALIIGGLFFGEARWVEAGRSLMLREMDEQVLVDGGHFERAPMYHAQVLTDFLESFTLLRAFGELDEVAFDRVRVTLDKMRHFLTAVTHPDGTLTLFNDSANTEECRPRPIVASVAKTIGPPVVTGSNFAASGYYTCESSESGDRIVVDAGPPAAKYNTAHAHCDLLSYELWLNGHPFVVDSGVHGYEGDRFREYARATRAHNTVIIDGGEQSEVWATFRMGARATLVSGEAESQDSIWRFRGSYRPYSDRTLLHVRRIERNADGTWLFVDWVEGAGQHSVESLIHLHPSVQARKDGSSIECEFAGGSVSIEPFGIAEIEIVSGSEKPVQGWYFPDFGIALATQTICLRSKVVHGEEFGYVIRRHA